MSQWVTGKLAARKRSGTWVLISALQPPNNSTNTTTKVSKGARMACFESLEKVRLTSAHSISAITGISVVTRIWNPTASSTASQTA